MGQTFASIPQRVNGDDIEADWFNLLQAAGANLEGGFTSFTLANNQSSPAAITGLIFTGVTSFELDYDIQIVTTGAGATVVGERGKLWGYLSGGVWTLGGPIGANCEGTGVSFSINSSTGQMYYTSANTTGTPSVSNLNYQTSTLGS